MLLLKLKLLEILPLVLDDPRAGCFHVFHYQKQDSLCSMQGALHISFNLPQNSRANEQKQAWFTLTFPFSYMDVLLLLS